MKRPGRVLGNLLAMVLTVFSLQAMAETQMAGRNFDHTTTGFPLTGVHATVACETCHVAGVFKGTAKTCDGCHALGKRIVATPKSTSHIVTDAPCDSCHFNNFTFLGARYNHGTAIPGQCVTCHNGRITTGRPASHNNGSLMQTRSCDACHRSYAFIPASWDHAKNGVAIGDHSCANVGCHISGSSNRYTRATATSPVSHSYTDTGQVCDTCHISYLVWTSTQHEPQTSPTCITCHNGSTAQGTPSGHVSIGTSDCGACHTSTVTWLGALGGMPSNHIPSTLWTPAATCSSCHPAGLTQGNAVLHTYLVVSPCTNCHLSPAPYLSSVIQTKSTSHTNGKDCVASGCHSIRYSSWNSP